MIGRLSLSERIARERTRRVGKANAGADRGALGLHDSPEYTVWREMISRCTNPKNRQFKDYGGRGIRVAAEWCGRGGFARFYAFLGARPSARHTLGRTDNDGPYAPGNVRWETRAEQMANFRGNKQITLGGRTQHAAAWARELKMAPSTFAERLRAGWTLSELLAGARQGRLDSAQ